MQNMYKFHDCSQLFELYCTVDSIYSYLKYSNTVQLFIWEKQTNKKTQILSLTYLEPKPSYKT